MDIDCIWKGFSERKLLQSTRIILKVHGRIVNAEIVGLNSEFTNRMGDRDIADFLEFAGLNSTEDFRVVQRSHVIAYSDELERRGHSPATMRRKLSALSSLYDYLCSLNAVPINPVSGVKRNTAGANQGNTPSL